MKDKTIKVLIFMAGAAIGSVITARLIKEKYEKIAEDEIADMRDYYNEKIKKKIAEKSEESSTEAADEDEKREYNKIVTDYNKCFVNEETKQVVKSEENEDKEETKQVVKSEENEDKEETIYIINPQEFGVLDDYETSFLNYYTDGYVTDEFDDVIEDPERLIGKEALENIGKYTEGLIHVRNESEMTDFEISEFSHDYMS